VQYSLWYVVPNTLPVGDQVTEFLRRRNRIRTKQFILTDEGSRNNIRNSGKEESQLDATITVY